MRYINVQFCIRHPIVGVNKVECTSTRILTYPTGRATTPYMSTASVPSNSFRFAMAACFGWSHEIFVSDAKAVEACVLEEYYGVAYANGVLLAQQSRKE